MMGEGRRWISDKEVRYDEVRGILIIKKVLILCVWLFILMLV